MAVERAKARREELLVTHVKALEEAAKALRREVDPPDMVTTYGRMAEVAVAAYLDALLSDLPEQAVEAATREGYVPESWKLKNDCEREEEVSVAADLIVSFLRRVSGGDS